MKKIVISLLIGILTLNISLAEDSKKKEFKVGDTLPKQAPAKVVNRADYRTLNWDEMLPADWDPMKPLKGLDLAKLQDSDPRASEALQKAREEWNKAPVVEKLNGTKVNVAGFVVPLDIDLDHVREFLVVPYFGACIHVPPPPSNQVIHVIAPANLSKAQQAMLKKALTVMDPVEVNGVIQTEPTFTNMGASGYRMTADSVEAYKATPTKP